jgi:hypothetical protein
LIIDYTGTTPRDSIRAMILAGRGAPGIGNATWNGANGIVSTNAATDPEARSIAYGENSALPLGAYATFGGQTVDGSSILIRYTRTADADLDGRVNDSDVTIVGAFYGQATSGQWYLGDFDYSGMCDDADVTFLGAFYDPAAPPLSAAYLTEMYGAEFATAFEAGQAMAPEPEMLGVFGLALCMRRRRR